MPANWSLPTGASLKSAVLSIFKERDVDAITLCETDPTNIPEKAIKYLRSANKFQERISAAWVDKVLSIAGGGTGAASASAARTSLGLGSMATQNSNAIAVTGGTVDGVPLDATDLVGSVPYACIPNRVAPIGCIFMWPNATAPSGFVLCQGGALNRVTFADLFAIIGTTYGIGDGSTTFNLPDLRQRFPLGKAASGTGVNLGDSGGTIDHIHGVAGHTHSISSAGAHTHGFSGTTDQPDGLEQVDHASPSFFVASNVHTHDFSGTTDSNGAHDHTGVTGVTGGATGDANPAFLTVNFIIKF